MTEKNDNTIFVGKKPLMSYVLAVVTQFGDGIKEVHIKARGKSISSAGASEALPQASFSLPIKR